MPLAWTSQRLILCRPLPTRHPRKGIPSKTFFGSSYGEALHHKSHSCGGYDIVVFFNDDPSALRIHVPMIKVFLVKEFSASLKDLEGSFVESIFHSSNPNLNAYAACSLGHPWVGWIAKWFAMHIAIVGVASKNIPIGSTRRLVVFGGVMWPHYRDPGILTFDNCRLRSGQKFGLFKSLI